MLKFFFQKTMPHLAMLLQLIEASDISFNMIILFALFHEDKSADRKRGIKSHFFRSYILNDENEIYGMRVGSMCFSLAR